MKVPATHHFGISRIREGESFRLSDEVVTEEPLEMQLVYGPEQNRQKFNLAVTMRTPGRDEELLRGFLITEGIISTHKEISSIRRPIEGPSGSQSILAELRSDVVFSPDKQQRHFYTTSSCGVCGKASIDMVRQVSPFRNISGVPAIKTHALSAMLHEFRASQHVFSRTGGIHAAALFDPDGKLLHLEEDVGRHNAVDKLVGASSESPGIPFSNHIMMVSGRAGFELVQKAAVTGVAFFAAVGAPSSLAVELALESDMTLVGFLKDEGMNVYSGVERVI